MRALAERYLMAAFVFAVTGAAMTPWPWTAPLVAAGFYVALSVVADRRTPSPEQPEAQP